MSKLTKLMEYKTAGLNDRKKILNSYSFNSYLNKSEKELLLDNDSYVDSLLTEEVYNAINTGAQKRRVMRDILPVINTNKYSIDTLYAEQPSGNIAEEIAGGAEIPVNTTYYSSGSVDIKSYGARARITEELIEDAEFSIIELELNHLGEAIENKLNQVAIETLIDGAVSANDVDASSAPLKYEHIGDAYETLGSLGWKPTDIIFRPRAVGQLVTNTPKNINYDGGNLFGLKSHILDTSSDSWNDTDSATNSYGLLLDKDNYGFIAMRKDMTISEYKEPIDDLTNLIVSIRFGVGVTHDNAAVRLLTV